MPVRIPTMSENLARAHELMRQNPGKTAEKQEKKVKDPEAFGFPASESSQLPQIQARLTLKGDIASDIFADCRALITSPTGRILYLELALGSDSSAHAVMGMVTDGRGQVEWRYHKPGSMGDQYLELESPVQAICQNARLAVPGYHGYVYHVVILERSGELILSRNHDELWRALREKLTCPTLPEWGRELMPRLFPLSAEIHSALNTHVAAVGIVMPCTTFGLPPGLFAHVLAPNANDGFDNIVGAYVREKGGL